MGDNGKPRSRVERALRGVEPRDMTGVRSVDARKFLDGVTPRPESETEPAPSERERFRGVRPLGEED